MADTSAKLKKASMGLGVAAAGIQAIPIFGQIAGAVLGVAAGATAAGAAKAAANEEKRREAEAAAAANREAMKGPSTVAGGRASTNSDLGAVLGDGGAGVGFQMTNDASAQRFSVLGSMMESSAPEGESDVFNDVPTLGEQEGEEIEQPQGAQGDGGTKSSPAPMVTPRKDNEVGVGSEVGGMLGGF